MSVHSLKTYKDAKEGEKIKVKLEELMKVIANSLLGLDNHKEFKFVDEAMYNLTQMYVFYELIVEKIDKELETKGKIK